MTPEELLAPHAKRKIRAFVVAPDVDNFTDSKLYDAFWSLIYGGSKAAVDHQTALDVEHELMTCDKRIADVLAGWRPESLSWTKPAPGGDA